MALSPEQMKLMQLLAPGAQQANASVMMPEYMEAQAPAVAEAARSPASAPTPEAPKASASRSSSLKIISTPPGLQDIQNELRKQLEVSRGQQQQNIETDKQALINQYSKKQDLDLSGGFAVAKMLGGKTAGKGYEAPEDVSKGDLGVRKELAKDQQALTDDQTNQLKAELQNKILGQSMQTQRMGLMQDRLNQKIYGQQVMGLRNDKTLNDLMTKNNAITRTADVLFSPGTDVNTTSLHDLQQTVTGALTGLQGGGGVGEREQRYMTDMDTTLAALKQKFGDTNSIPRNDPILVHYMGLAQAGQAFLEEQYGNRINALAGGHEDVTEQPQFSDMYHNQIDQVKKGLAKPKFFQQAPESAAAVQRAYGQGSQTAYANDYDGSAPPPANADSNMKAMRLKYLQQKAGK